MKVIRYIQEYGLITNLTQQEFPHYPPLPNNNENAHEPMALVVPPTIIINTFITWVPIQQRNQVPTINKIPLICQHDHQSPLFNNMPPRPDPSYSIDIMHVNIDNEIMVITRS